MLYRILLYSVESFDISASAGSDYTAVNTSVTFGPTDTKQTVAVLITNDDLVENSEQFRLHLSTDDGQVKTNDDEMIITITDSDCKCCQYLIPSLSYRKN